MSIKAKYFKSKFEAGPAVRYSYLIRIPGFDSLAYLISGAPIPTPVRGSVSMTYFGETYSFPTPVELSSGDWAVTMYETGTFEVMHSFYDAFASDLERGPFFNVDIFSFQMDNAFAVQTRLLNCWVKSMTAPTLEASASASVSSCTLTLSYNGVELVESELENPSYHLMKGKQSYAMGKKASHAISDLGLIPSLIAGATPLLSALKTADLVTSNIRGAFKVTNSYLK